MARVFIADDDRVVRATMSYLPGSKGHDVAEAAGGRESFARVASKNFDLLIIDIFMPDMDGLETIERVFAAQLRATDPGRVGDDVPVRLGIDRATRFSRHGHETRRCARPAQAVSGERAFDGGRRLLEYRAIEETVQLDCSRLPQEQRLIMPICERQNSPRLS